MSQDKRLRIHFSSNAMWATSGYSSQIAELLPLIRDEGYPLSITNFFGQQGGKFMLDGILQYPIINHIYGSDALIHHANDFKADIVFTLQDQWVLNPQDLAQVKHWIPITPVDHDPVAPPVLQNLKFAYRVVSYSEFGHRELQRNGIASTYIQHTVNTDLFKPMDKKARKAAAGLPADCFIVGMVAANKENPPRKSFQEVLDAFRLFLKEEPKALLYIHTNNDFPGGFNIKQYAAFLGIQDKVLMPDAYTINFNTDKAAMARTYNSFDMLLMPSISEGFGIPAIEAQSCGIPVIVNRFTSMPELVKEGITGEICEVLYRRFSPQGSYMGQPDYKSIFDCMMKLYKADRIKMGEKAREFMIDTYDTRTIFKKKWAPYLSLLESEVYPS